jgi:hypothetical protein
VERAFEQGGEKAASAEFARVVPERAAAQPPDERSGWWSCPATFPARAASR